MKGNFIRSWDRPKPIKKDIDKWDKIGEESPIAKKRTMKLNKTRRFSVVYQLDTNKINNIDGRSTSRTI